MVGVSVSAVRLYHFVLTTAGLERLVGRTKSIIGLRPIVLKIHIEYQVFHSHNNIVSE